MKPNIQNIPARTETGRKIQRAFAARWRLSAGDFTQIERRIARLLKENTAGGKP